MRRRTGDDVGAAPPFELVDYRAWCAGRGLRLYGDPENPETMRAAVAQWEAWERLRREWADAHGVDECDLGGTDSAPFDSEAI